MVTNYIIVMIWVKTSSTESLKGLDIALNYIYTYFLTHHKGSIIIWIVNFFLGINSIICKFQCSKFDVNQKSFCVFKAFKPRINNCFFSIIFFSLWNVHLSFSKLEKILTWMIKQTKGIEIAEIHFYNICECIWFKHDFCRENYGFWRCDFNKSYSFFMVKT
jgi:hypothetical protein